MSETATATTYVNEVDEITKVMKAYIDGARTGKGAAMKPAFDDGATICGYVGPDLSGPKGYPRNRTCPGPPVESQFADLPLQRTGPLKWIPLPAR